MRYLLRSNLGRSTYHKVSLFNLTLLKCYLSVPLSLQNHENFARSFDVRRQHVIITINISNSSIIISNHLPVLA